MATEIELSTNRVIRLESEKRFFKLAAAGVALVAALVLMGAIKSPRTIGAEKIVLLESNGHTRVTIGTPEFVGAAVDMRPDDPAIRISASNFGSLHRLSTSIRWVA